MIRRGKVKDVDKNGMGIIMDENHQEIRFSSESIFDDPEVDSEVTFNIVLTTEGLRAIDVVTV